MDATKQTARRGSAGLIKTAALSAAILSGGAIAATSSDADPTGFGPDPNALPYGGASVERDAPPAFRPDRADPSGDLDAAHYARPSAGPAYASPVVPSPYAIDPAHDLYWTRPAVPTTPVSAQPVTGNWRDPYAGYPTPVAPVPPAVHFHQFPAAVGGPAVPYAHRHVHYTGYGYGGSAYGFNSPPAPRPMIGPGYPPGIGSGAGGLGLGTLGRLLPLAGLGGGTAHRHDEKHDTHEAKAGSGKKEHHHGDKEDDDD